MTAAERYVVRLAVTDDGTHLYWLVRVATGERLLSSTFPDTIRHLADAMNRRHRDAASVRQEAGSW